MMRWEDSAGPEIDDQKTGFEEEEIVPVTQKKVYVYDDFSFDEPVILGTPYVSIIKGGENYSFEYSPEWLQRTKMSVSLGPELMPFGGRQYPSSKNIFGLFADASPDRWGRVLMNKCECILAEKEGCLQS